MKFGIEAAVSAAQGGTAVGPPQSRKLDWIHEENFSFFHSENQLKRKLATYYWVQSHTYTKIWWSYEVLCWSCSECSSRWDCSWTAPSPPTPPPPPPPKVGNWTGFAKKNFHFFHPENQLKRKFCHRESPSVGTEANPSSFMCSAVIL